MNHLRSMLKTHKIAIGLAILTSIIVAFPQIYFRIDHRSDGIYHGIELLPDSPWSPRAREFQDGHNLGSMYYKDGKNDPYLFQPLGSAVVAYMGKIFSLDINNTILLSRFVLSFIVFLLFYYFIFLLSRNKLVALAGASMLVFADSILTYNGVIDLFHGISPVDFLRIARPVNPAMVYIPFLGFLILFWHFYEKRDWRYGVLGAIVLGLNFYDYFYTWTFLYAFGGVLSLLCLVRRKWREALQIVLVYIGGILVAIPYIFNLYHASLFQTYKEVGARFGIIYAHRPLFVGFSVIGALIIFLLFFPKENRNRYFFGLALLLAPFVTMNQQILTGRIMQVNHYHWFFHKPVAIIFVLIIIFYLLGRSRWVSYRNALMYLIIAGSIAGGIYVQTYSYYNGTNDGGQVAIERQKYGPVMDWLNQHVPKESVVLANNEASHMVVIYTPLNVFFHRAGMYSLVATKDRLLDQLFTFYRLQGVEAQDVQETFFGARAWISSNIYGMHYRDLGGSYKTIPDDMVNDIILLYKKDALSVSASEWIKHMLTKYEVDYIMWDKKIDPEWKLDQYPFLEEVAIFGDIVVYHFLRKDTIRLNKEGLVLSKENTYFHIIPMF